MSDEKEISAEPPCWDEMIKYYQSQEQYISKYIELSDNKAIAAIITASAFLAYLTDTQDLDAILSGELVLVQAIFLAIPFAALLTCVVVAAYAVIPRTPHASGSLYFWGSIAGHSSSGEFLKAIESASRSKLHADRIDQIYQLSLVLKRKNTLVGRSMIVGLAGLFFGIFYIFVS